MRKKQILPFVTTWRDREGVMLGKICQTEKEKSCMISLHMEFFKKLIDT